MSDKLNIEKDIDFKFKPNSTYKKILVDPKYFEILKRKADAYDEYMKITKEFLKETNELFKGYLG